MLDTLEQQMHVVSRLVQVMLSTVPQGKGFATDKKAG